MTLLLTVNNCRILSHYRTFLRSFFKSSPGENLLPGGILMKKFYRSATLLMLAYTITSLTACGGSQSSSNADNPDTDNPKVSLHASAITATDTSVTITISKTGTS